MSGLPSGKIEWTRRTGRWGLIQSAWRAKKVCFGIGMRKILFRYFDIRLIDDAAWLAGRHHGQSIFAFAERKKVSSSQIGKYFLHKYVLIECDDDPLYRRAAERGP